MTPDERWLNAVWPFVRVQLPGSPGQVLEIGCGPLGGIISMLRAAGYGATGIDPKAPDGPRYRQIDLERYDVPQPVGVIVACTSLHPVAGLGQVLDLAGTALVTGGVLVVVERARERFDEATARWCSERLPPPGDEPGRLNDRLADWRASGRAWDTYCRSWAESEGLHSGQDILRELRARFDTIELGYGPCFFPDLAGTSEADEHAAIDTGQIQAKRIQYRGSAGKATAQPDSPAFTTPRLP